MGGIECSGLAVVSGLSLVTTNMAIHLALGIALTCEWECFYTLVWCAMQAAVFFTCLYLMASIAKQSTSARLADGSLLVLALGAADTIPQEQRLQHLAFVQCVSKAPVHVELCCLGKVTTKTLLYHVRVLSLAVSVLAGYAAIGH